MFEREIILEGVEAVDFYGVNNQKIDILRSFFPKLMIVPLGNLIKVYGDETEIEVFGNKLDLLVDHYHQYHCLSEEMISQILLDDGEGAGPVVPDEEGVLVFGNNGKPIRAKTPNQRKLVDICSHNDLIFAIGPAGTGKTYTAIALAVKALKNREIRKIILSRPAVEAGERLGFLPGDLKEKIDPYLQPLYDALLDMIPPRKLEDLMKDGIIQIAPLAFMRGRTLSNAFVILDEAQNTTENQLKMFLTRMGVNTKFVITGDITQIDLPSSQQSGLIQAIKILKGVEDISFVQFDKGDIVRHRLVRDIVEAYEKFHSKDPGHQDLKLNKEEKGNKKK
ncbi:MAG: PhoH family protein [Bacteroidota bacterium]|nr:PhoH family protein [Bacteroidota bacterium]